MRLFVALQLPLAVRRPLAETAARLRPRLPPARWVPVTNLHLTLLFLGHTEPDRLAALDRLLASCFAAHGPLPLRLKDGGCFPPRRPARVAWVGFEPCPAVIELQARLASAVAAHLATETDSRPFHPHLTLARPRRPWPRAAVDRWREAFAGPRGPAFQVIEGHLMRSHLGPGGAVHEPLGAYPLQEFAAGSV